MKRQNGFTLIEFIIVAAIAGILFAVIFPTITKAVKASTTPAAEVHFPEPNWVVDDAKLLSQPTIVMITSRAKVLADQGGPEIAVVTVPSIAPLSVEEYSIKLAEKWKVGKKGKDNGIIELVALKERKIRIEVGRGLEGALNDAKAGRIISQVIGPKLHEGKFDDGIRDGFNAIVEAIKGEK